MSTMTFTSAGGTYGLARAPAPALPGYTVRQSRRALASAAACLAAFVLASALVYAFQVASRPSPDIVTFAFRV